MIRNAITPLVASGLLALNVGCQNPAEKQLNERAEARKEIPEAAKEAEKKIENAREDLAEAEKKFGEQVGEAQQGITDEVDEANKEIARADNNASKAMVERRYERFEILKNESEAAFASRADAAIARLQTDLDSATARAQSATADKDLQEDVTDATQALDEARKDLVELRSKTGKLFDDGRVGVGLAVNKAQRELTEAWEEIAELKM